MIEVALLGLLAVSLFFNVYLVRGSLKQAPVIQYITLPTPENLVTEEVVEVQEEPVVDAAPVPAKSDSYSPYVNRTGIPFNEAYGKPDAPVVRQNEGPQSRPYGFV